jgi:hypothetical protein
MDDVEHPMPSRDGDLMRETADETRAEARNAVFGFRDGLCRPRARFCPEALLIAFAFPFADEITDNR